ncbi:hypothetical protein [Dactylosporangium sp. NPDC000521]
MSPRSPGRGRLTGATVRSLKYTALARTAMDGKKDPSGAVSTTAAGTAGR